VSGALVLDTHVLLWWLSAPVHLSDEAARRVGAATRLWVPAICAWEIATLARRGRIGLDRPCADWLAQAFGRPEIACAPLDWRVAAAAGGLAAEDLHGDPADRLIVATALALRCPLVSKDARVRAFAGVEVLW
jgi:PIN domain nuclease of toxin-antitoxin system